MHRKPIVQIIKPIRGNKYQSCVYSYHSCTRDTIIIGSHNKLNQFYIIFSETVQIYKHVYYTLSINYNMIKYDFDVRNKREKNIKCNPLINTFHTFGFHNKKNVGL